MVKLVADYSEEATKAKRGSRGQPKADILGPYMELISPVAIGHSREVELEEGEKQRLIKRRLTSASKLLGKQIAWRTAPVGHLLFEVVEKPSETGTKPKSKGGKRRTTAASA